MEIFQRFYNYTKERSKTPKKTRPYDYKTDMSNKVVRTNLLFTILLKEWSNHPSIVGAFKFETLFERVLKKQLN